MLTTNLFGQYKTSQEAIDFINDRLTHSIVQKVDANGLVTMKAPSERITFMLGEASFNYNDLNGDSRVRVVCNNCLKHYENKEFEKQSSRQSFLCDSEDEAFEVIKAFGFLKTKYPGSTKTGGIVDRKLGVSDTTLGFSSVETAVEVVNRMLIHSVITGIDEKGVMTINAPSDNYRVDLKHAEFAFNDLSDDPKVRIYGDFCIEEIDEEGSGQFMSRQSFTAHSRFKAYRAIKALYYIKTAFSDLQPAKVPQLRNVKRNRLSGYTTVAEAIDYVNDRLTYSVIMGVDDKGVMSINAPDEVYRVHLKKAKFRYTENSKMNIDWLGITFDSGRIDGVQVECNNCLEKFSSPGDKDIVDEQTFQCESETLVKEVIKALTYIRERSK